MIKSFISHLQDNKKLYSFKIRLAVECTPELMKRITESLDAYEVESISEAKRLPLQEDPINFPKLGPIEINLIDVSLGYPVIAEALTQLLSERAGIPNSHMTVYPLAQEADRTPGAAFEKGDALLETEPSEYVQEDVYGNEYISNFLDELETRDYEIAGDKTSPAKTTNDLDQGTQSPMTNQNKVPTAEDL